MVEESVFLNETQENLRHSPVVHRPTMQEYLLRCLFANIIAVQQKKKNISVEHLQRYYMDQNSWNAVLLFLPMIFIKHINCTDELGWFINMP